MTTPITAQGPAVQGMPQGYGPGFPPPLGIEQLFGQSQQHGGFPQHGYAQYGLSQPFGSTGQQPYIPGQQPYMQSPFGGQQFGGQQFGGQQFGQQQVPVQQLIQTLVSQLLPTAQQVILPQLVATATQQIPQHLYQFVAQQVAWQLGQQPVWTQSQFGQPQFGQPQFGQPGQHMFGRPQQGSF
jgi:hypothetical protein